MFRSAKMLAFIVICSTPALSRAQPAGHAHTDGPAAGAHDHGGPVDCRALAVPPWSGLPDADRAKLRRLEASLVDLRTTEAAARAGFQPIPNIPTMGVHWVNRQRTQAGFRLEEPDHLMFASVNGRDELVGVAYAFRDRADAAVPDAFESGLAEWHDHPGLGLSGQTLHMLHVWLVPSPYGPFAGNNFFLPFMARGASPPDPCWIETAEDAERLEQVAAVLAIMERQDAAAADPAAADAPVRQGRALAGARAGLGAGGLAGARLGQAGGRVLAGQAPRSFDRLEGWIAALDIAARNHDRDSWNDAANRMLEALSPIERQVAEAVRQRLKGIQTPTAVRNELPARGALRKF